MMNCIRPLLALGLAALPAVSGFAALEADFDSHIQPLLSSACVGCHGPDKDKGGLRLDSYEWMMKGGDGGACVEPGNPAKSSLYTLTALPADHDDIMPPKGEPLTLEQQGLLKDWILKGAKWPSGKTLKQVRRIDFVEDVQPILEFECLACHREGYDKGGVMYSTRAMALESGDSGPSLKPWKADRSRLYSLTMLTPDDDELMPPTEKGGPLAKEAREILRLWIEQGAVWPEDLKLTPKKKDESDSGGDSLEFTKQIHQLIVEKQKVREAAQMKAYKNSIPGSSVAYEMLPIPGGRFLMGTPEGEAGRKPDEGPQVQVKIDPFWMGKTEVTWNAFELFMYPTEIQFASTATPQDIAYKKLVDALSTPTKPYVEMSFGMGKDDFPAISMTQHSANKFCQWLSAKTGHFYRLPTEAEWEYACRAGTTTAFHFGDDPKKLGEYAWFEDNSDWKYQKVGQKKPNPWGLHDMHGNVAEWCLDQYNPNFLSAFKGQVADNPWNQATTLYPRVVRGGSWDHPPAVLRSGARIASDSSWKIQDPQLPKSIWYHTDAQFLGMRIVRPLKIPTAEEMHVFWNGGRIIEE